MFNDTDELNISEELRSRISGFKGQLDEQATVMMWGSPQPVFLVHWSAPGGTEHWIPFTDLAEAKALVDASPEIQESEWSIGTWQVLETKASREPGQRYEQPPRPALASQIPKRRTSKRQQAEWRAELLARLNAKRAAGNEPAAEPWWIKKTQR